MSDLEKVLKDVGKVCEEAAKRRETWRREGKYYNVFIAIGADEMTHSAFIADLLNPNGAHGAGDKFLRAFLRLVPPKGCLREDYLNVDSLSFRLETEHKTEDGRIDIIADDGRHALIIENKIHARDQKSQLARYSKYHRDHKLIYLTLDGHEPSNASTGGDKDLEYTCMSYEKHILPWLNECLEIAFNLHHVRELINQYIYVIKGLTHTTMEDKELEKVTEIAIEDGNLAATAAILQARYKIRDALITRYIFEPLKEEFKHEGFECEIDTAVRQINLSKKDVWKKGCIQMKIDNKNGWYIRVEDELVAKQKLSCFENDPNIYGSTYGYSYTPWDWESPASYVAIKNGEIAKWLIKEINYILKELEGNKIEL